MESYILVLHWVFIIDVQHSLLPHTFQDSNLYLTVYNMEKHPLHLTSWSKIGVVFCKIHLYYSHFKFHCLD